MTGITGRVGRHVIEGVVDAGHEVAVLARRPLSPDLNRFVVATTIGDITDRGPWRTALAKPPDAVVHLAGVSTERPEAGLINVASAQAMVHECRQSGVPRIVYASSNCALGHCDRPPELPFPLQRVPIDESHPIAHVTQYGQSKLLAELALRQGASPAMKTIALRPAWIWRDAEINARVETTWSDETQAKNFWAYLHVVDFVRAVREAMTTITGSEFEAVFLSAADTSADAPTEQLLDHFHPELQRTTRFPGHTSLFSSVQASRLLNFEPTHSWRT